MRTKHSSFALILLLVGASITSASGCAIGKSSNPLWDPLGLTAWARKSSSDSLAAREAPKPPSIVMEPNPASSIAANSSSGTTNPAAPTDRSSAPSNLAGNLSPEYPQTRYGDSAYPTRPVGGASTGGSSGGYYNNTASAGGSSGAYGASTYSQPQNGYYSTTLPGGDPSRGSAYGEYSRTATVPDEYRSGGSYGGAAGGNPYSADGGYSAGPGGSYAATPGGAYATSPGGSSAYSTPRDPYSAGAYGTSAGSYNAGNNYSAAPYANSSPAGSSYGSSPATDSVPASSGGYRPGSTGRTGTVPWEPATTESQPYSSSGVQPARYDQSQPSTYGAGTSASGGSYGGDTTQPYSSGGGYSSGTGYPSGSSSGAGSDSNYGTYYK